MGAIPIYGRVHAPRCIPSNYASHDIVRECGWWWRIYWMPLESLNLKHSETFWSLQFAWWFILLGALFGRKNLGFPPFHWDNQPNCSRFLACYQHVLIRSTGWTQGRLVAVVIQCWWKCWWSSFTSFCGTGNGIILCKIQQVFLMRANTIQMDGSA